MINPEYGQSLDQPFDIFLAQSQSSSRLIEYQFSSLGQINKSAYGLYDSELPNKSASDIQTAIQQGAPAVAGYLFATLEAYNATGTVDDPTGNATNTGVSPASPSSGSLSNTALARFVPFQNDFLYLMICCSAGSCYIQLWAVFPLYFVLPLCQASTNKCFFGTPTGYPSPRVKICRGFQLQSLVWY